MPNETIHDEIESWLAADVHDQLSSEERAAFEQHLAACPACRALQQEEKNMNQLLENTLAKESADPAFEQRMVSRFRDKVPAPSGGLISFFSRTDADAQRPRSPRSPRSCSPSCRWGKW